MNEYRFPVLLPYKDRARLQHLPLPRTVPWSLLEPHEGRAKRNHDQSLKVLASRGGLSPLEMWLIVHDKPLSFACNDFDKQTQVAIEWLMALETTPMTPDDPLLALILAEADRLADPAQPGPRRPSTPLGWATWLAETAERMAVFVGSVDAEEQARNLSEVRGTAIRAAALGVVVCRMADEGRRGDG